MKKPFRVIHVMTHPPAYAAYANQPRPEINWDTPKGSWVGIWGYDWADLLAIEVRKINEDIVHEIWQPDTRADKIYSQEISPGVIHRNFPAITKFQWIGVKKKEHLKSQGMLRYLSQKDTKKTIFHIGRHLNNTINESIIKNYPDSSYLASFHGQINMPIMKLFRYQKNFLAKLNHLYDHKKLKRLFNRMSHVTYQTEKNVKTLERYYKGPKSKLTMGINFEKYNPFNKICCRTKLGLPYDTKILITMCNLNELKQVDKLIEVVSVIQKNFLLIIVGHGSNDYEKYLKEKSSKLRAQGKILFTGYRTGREKNEYLSASDLFIHVSKSEAGPVVNMEAMAIGLPILTTDTGNTAEVLKKYNAGCIVGTKDYPKWKMVIEKYLTGGKIKRIDVDIAKSIYDWRNIALKFNNIYKQLFSNNERRKSF